MATDRLLRIMARLGEVGGEAPNFASLCLVASEVSATQGAAIMLMAAASPRGLLWATDEVGAHLEELQFTLGEGPGLDAHAQSAAVVEPDLTEPATPRWIAFTPAAISIGVRSVFAFPLMVGGVGLGALNLYRSRPGLLTDDQHADSLVIAEVVSRTILTVQADTPVGILSSLIESGSNLRLIVHQASGMVSVQMGISVADALVRLRAYAVAHDLLVDEVAIRVIDRRLRFDDDASGTERA